MLAYTHSHYAAAVVYRYEEPFAATHLLHLARLDAYTLVHAFIYLSYAF